MKKPFPPDLTSIFQKMITDFEVSRLKDNKSKQSYGIVYTPEELVNFIVKNAFNHYFFDLIQKFNLASNRTNDILKIIRNNKTLFRERIEKFKILDPAFGSGRFLLSIAKFIFALYKSWYPDKNDFEIKKKVIENNLFGVEIDEKAYFISKLRLLNWLYTERKIFHDVDERINSFNINLIFDKLDIKFNIYNLDFLLEFDKHQYDIILGNPPYIENKKIRNFTYKDLLAKRFETAYRLYDFSILFIEKSLELLKERIGILSFIMPNKFLAANYGVKIRNLLLSNTKLKELINISSLSAFNNTATYPIIITLKKDDFNSNNSFNIRDISDLEDIANEYKTNSKQVAQEAIKRFPNYVIPTSADLDLIKYVFNNLKPLSEVANDIKIIYRPFGFINWAENLQNVSQTKHSDKDLILLGTGNVDRFLIKFKKRIKIAKNNLKISYFQYNDLFEKNWRDLNSEKLMFREIAKEPTWVYDPGIFTNLTGLYSVKIPSFGTNKLFCLLAIMNSKIIDFIFKKLYGSLHMSGGYLRFNGSFIKSLPIPETYPESISQIGKILQFLSQLKYEMSTNSDSLNLSIIDRSRIDKLLNIYSNICNALINQLYLKDKEFQELDFFFSSKNSFPSIKLKYFEKLFDLPKYQVYQKEEVYDIIEKIENELNNLNLNKFLNTIRRRVII